MGIYNIPAEWQGIGFTKYQGAGNDFVVFDNRAGQLPVLSPEVVAAFCDRRFGIGADGLMTLELAEGYHYRMRYFNADGHEGSMCGNGGRCIAHFAWAVGQAPEREQHFVAVDGPHFADIQHNGAEVKLQMGELSHFERLDTQTYLLDTGSPHYVALCATPADVAARDMLAWGKAVRYSPRYAQKGVNVNAVAFAPDANTLTMRTYERGVEAETLACGTGAVAAALAAWHFGNLWAPGTPPSAPLQTAITVPGGLLRIELLPTGELFLIGPAVPVFSGICI
jgi:diaminopimelate epimerase